MLADSRGVFTAASGYDGEMPEGSEHVRVGWRERVDLPAWGLRGVRAKIDTGARTSAIDVAQIEHLDGGRVRFEVVYRQKPERRTRWVEADAVRTSVVKPSSGQRQERVVCRTLMRLGTVEREIEISLVCRRKMLCRMLVGRTALEGAFVVDVSGRDLAPPPPPPPSSSSSPRTRRTNAETRPSQSKGTPE